MDNIHMRLISSVKYVRRFQVMANV